jgi:RHS repeat-associated protein
VTDSTGAVLSNGRLFYDPWGKMKLAGGGNDTNCSLPQVPSGSPTTRGFTGQEQMPNICADNFNARVYNPLLGRFLTPDSVIPDTYAPQSLNRYTYVDNMPLSVTDPTGHVDAPGDSQKKLPNKLPPPWEPAPNGGACRCARIGNVVIASDSSGHVLAVFDIGLLDDAAAHQAADGDGSAASATTSGVASSGAGNPVAGAPNTSDFSENDQNSVGPVDEGGSDATNVSSDGRFSADTNGEAAPSSTAGDTQVAATTYGTGARVTGVPLPAGTTDPFDPKGLNKPVLSPVEVPAILKTVDIIQNGTAVDKAALNPHFYGNRPDPTTGARLPPGVYTTYDVPMGTPGIRGDTRVIQDNLTGQLYYTNNHYLSFYPIR